MPTLVASPPLAKPGAETGVGEACEMAPRVAMTCQLATLCVARKSCATTIPNAAARGAAQLCQCRN
eukprot:13315399-Alexandrium_andersonii.AAC.1